MAKAIKIYYYPDERQRVLGKVRTAEYTFTKHSHDRSIICVAQRSRVFATRFTEATEFTQALPWIKHKLQIHYGPDVEVVQL